MKKRIIFSIAIIVLTFAIVGGGTFAWFTSEAEVENQFAAGTVMIDADEDPETGVRKHGKVTEIDKVNPGDCYTKEIEIQSTGTKGTLLRVKLDDNWDYDGDGSMENWFEENWESLATGFYYDFDEDGFLDAPDPHNALQFDVFPDWDVFKAYLSHLEEEIDDLVTFELYSIDNFEQKSEDNWDGTDGFDTIEWEYHNGYFYITDDDIVPFEGSEDDPVTIYAYIKVCFAGKDMTNEFQLAGYNLNAVFEAIQASNNASGDHWEVDSTYDPSDEKTSDNWTGYDFE